MAGESDNNSGDQNGADTGEGSENNSDTSSQASPDSPSPAAAPGDPEAAESVDPSVVGPPALSPMTSVEPAMVQDYVSRHAPGITQTQHGAFAHAISTGMTPAQATDVARSSREDALSTYGLSVTDKEKANLEKDLAVLAAPFTDIGDPEAHKAGIRAAAEAQLADMAPGARFNRESGVKADVAKAERSVDAVMAAREQAQKDVALGTLTPQTVISGKVDPALDAVYSSKFGEQATNLASAFAAGVAPDKISALGKTDPLGIASTVLGGIMKGPAALADVAIQLGRMTEPDLIKALGLDAVANPFGKASPAVNMAMSVLGPFATPAKMAASAIGLATQDPIHNLGALPNMQQGNAVGDAGGDALRELLPLFNPQPAQKQKQDDPLAALFNNQNIIPKI